MRVNNYSCRYTIIVNYNLKYILQYNEMSPELQFIFS